MGVGLHPRTGVPDVGSVRAARQAAWLSSRTGAEVTLLHAAWAEDGSGPVELASKATEELQELGALLSRVSDHGLQGRHVAVQVADDRGEEAGQGFAALGRARDYPQGSGPTQPEATGNGWVGPPRAGAQASPEACAATP